MPTAERRIRFGPFDLNVGSGELRKGPTRLKVPLQSIEILKALLERPDELVTRDELRQRLWPSNTFVDFEHGLNAAVGRLREALGESADTPKFIETLPKRGYRFIGTLTVEAGAQPGEPLVQPAVVPISASPAPSDLERESAAAARAATHRGRLRAAKIVVPAALVFVVGGAVWVANQWARPGAERRPVDSVPVTSYEGIEVDPALSPDGNHVAFGWEGESGRDLDIYVKLVDGGPPVRVTTEPSEERAPAWSPDGRRIAFLRSLPRRAEGYEQAAIIVAPSLGGGPERRLTDVHAIPYRDPSLAFNWVSWMPDAQRLLFADQTSPVSAAIFTCQVESCDRRQLTHPGPGVQDSAPVASPDGKRIAFVRRDGGRVLTGRIFVLEVDGDRPIGEPRPVGDDDRVVNVTWTHDGRGLIYDAGGRLESGLWRIGVEGGTPEAILTNVRASRPSVDRQGKRLVFQVTTTDTNIWRMPGPGSDTLARAAGHIPLIKSTLLDA
jgi:DNA-binding winged helix-turn-helix (wHTH) protein/Tol biopolymer transport system component